MGLYHSTYRAYGFEIPDTDFNALETVLEEQPGPDRVQRLFLGDAEKTLLVTDCELIEECAFLRLTPEDFARYEVPAWNKALHDAAVRLGHEQHPDPSWLLIHNYR